jgi:hypothetical protein
VHNAGSTAQTSIGLNFVVSLAPNNREGLFEMTGTGDLYRMDTSVYSVGGPSGGLHSYTLGSFADVALWYLSGKGPHQPRDPLTNQVESSVAGRQYELILTEPSQNLNGASYDFGNFKGEMGKLLNMSIEAASGYPVTLTFTGSPGNGGAVVIVPGSYTKLTFDGDLTLQGNSFGGIRPPSTANSTITITLAGSGVKLQKLGTPGTLGGIYSSTTNTFKLVMEGGAITNFAPGVSLITPLGGVAPRFQMKGGTINGDVNAPIFVMSGGYITGTVNSSQAWWGTNLYGSIGGVVAVTLTNTGVQQSGAMGSLGASYASLPDGSTVVKAWQ